MKGKGNSFLLSQFSPSHLPFLFSAPNLLLILQPLTPTQDQQWRRKKQQQQRRWSNGSDCTQRRRLQARKIGLNWTSPLRILTLSLSLSQSDLQKSDPLGFWVLSKILIWVLRKKMGFPSKKEKEEGRTARKRRGHCRRYWNSTFTRSYIHLFIYFTVVVPSRLYQSYFFFTNLDAWAQ